MMSPPLPEDSGRRDGDGWIVGATPAARTPRTPRPSWRPPRRLILAIAIVVALVVLIAAAPAAATITLTRPTDAVCRCGERPPIQPGGTP